MSLQRPISSKNVKALRLCLAVTAVLSLIPISSYAIVDWEEGFDYANDTAFGAVWEHSCLGNPGISTLRPHTGAKSAREVFNGRAQIDPGAGGCFMHRPMSARSEQVYTRWWMYLDNLTTVGTVGTKITRHEDTIPGYPGIWWNISPSGYLLQAAVEGVILNNGTQDTEVVWGGVIPQNQWVCIETYLSMGTPGVDNGIVRAWVNGTQIMNKTNQRMRSATLIQKNGPNVKFGRIKMYTQHGYGTRYTDEYAVSRDARIGCGSASISSDTTPPKPPQIQFIK